MQEFILAIPDKCVFDTDRPNAFTFLTNIKQLIQEIQTYSPIIIEEQM